MSRVATLAAAGLLLAQTGLLVARQAPGPAASQAGAIRLSGTVEAVRARAVMVPRLAGQSAPTLVITHLVHPGARVEPGDLLVEFDRQEQIRNALDRQAEVDDLDGQIQKKHSDQLVAQAADETALALAERDIARAKLDIVKNEFLPAVDAEKNTLALEQANAKFKQLQDTFVLKRRAAAAELKVLEIQRERSDKARRYAQGNALLMTVRAPFAGLAVLKTVWSGSTMAEVQEGQEVRPGTPILDIIDATAMQVRARLNQADIGQVSAGQAAKIRLDAYPGLVFDGKVESISPLGAISSLTATVRTFVTVVSIAGTSPQLMPDLTASVELVTRAGQPPASTAPRAGGH